LNCIDVLLELDSTAKQKNFCKTILDDIPLIIFQKNIIQIYQEKNKIYGKNSYLTSSFNHMYLNPEDATSFKKKIELNFIIEIGFLVYSIL
jgi:hypothetical protein